MIAGVVLTFNSEASILRTLDPLRRVTNTIYIVDSFSTDRTVEICLQNGCQVTQRSFSTYAEQRNWAIENFQTAAGWQLHVDADEELDEELVAEIRGLDLDNSQYDGYIFLRRIVFMKKLMRFGGISKTWHLRLFRSGTAKVEDRLYDQHFICCGQTGTIGGSMLDYQEMSLSDWTVRHNRWSDLEARELCTSTTKTSGVLKGNRLGNRIEKKRYQKELYYNFPLLLRAFGYFFYRYIIKFGLFDGKEGLIYHVLQGFWFRFIVDAKIYEMRNNIKSPAFTEVSDQWGKSKNTTDL